MYVKKKKEVSAVLRLIIYETGLFVLSQNYMTWKK